MRWAIGINRYGSPDIPYLIPATKYYVYMHATKKIAMGKGNTQVTVYKCDHCVNDPQVIGGCWHPKHLTQVDHRWASANTLKGMSTNDNIYKVYLMWIASSYPAILNFNNKDKIVKQLYYNDLDNLEVVCTGHNFDKRNKAKYMQPKNKMSIDFILNKEF